MADLLLIRHAASASFKRLAGRTDVPALLPDELAPPRAALSRLYGSAPHRLVSSPALRCRQTVEALFPGIDFSEDERLWEQDFGAWEGLETSALPDLGPLSRAELAAHRPPGGESFLEMTTRGGAALQEIASSGPAIIFTHAGIIRAALGLALGDAAQGLAFSIAPLSATAITALPDGNWAISFVNLPLCS